MRHLVQPTPPAPERGPYRIAWWQASPGDDSSPRHTSCASLAEAEEVLTWLAQDPAAGDFRCSWLEPADCEAIPF